MPQSKSDLPLCSSGPIHMTYTLDHQQDEEPAARLAAAETSSDQRKGQAADILESEPVRTSGDSFTHGVPPLAIVMLVSIFIVTAQAGTFNDDVILLLLAVSSLNTLREAVAVWL